MKKRFLLPILATCIVLSCSKSDDGPEEPAFIPDGQFPEKVLIGSWKMRTQDQVESFGAMNYTHITGALEIDPEFETGNFPIDLTPLRSIERVEGAIYILDNPELQSLEGLHNIRWAGRVFVQGNEKLENLDGLRNIENVAYENPNVTQGRVSEIWIRKNAALKNIDALRNVPSAYTILIANNPMLQNLDGLSGIVETEYLRTDVGCDSQPWVPPYCGNESLTDFCGLQNLFTNGTYDFVRITGNAYNPSIQDIIDGNCSQ